jgi:hypothetical protein
MILYYTSSRPQIVEGGRVVVPCPSAVCKARGFTKPHLCFSTEPLTGLGEFAFQVDIPIDLIQKYEYKNDFRSEERARVFAVPNELIATLPVTRSRYEEITGNPWNQWTIVVLDRSGQGGAGLLGKWAIVWQSRDGIFSARVGRKSQDGRFMSIDVAATPEFNPEQDYLVIEGHEEYEKEGAPGQIKETWRLKTQAGVTPQWVVFPSLWQDWVWNESVRASALDYLTRCAPELRRDISFAETMKSKTNVARAWREVADKLNLVLSRRLGQDIYLGKFSSHSWTAVRAMPLRIAGRVSENVPYEAWAPPLPQPEFAHPNDSGRVILANLYGAYPKRGPGVDHDPQDRPYTGQEGELKNSFSQGRIGAAPVLAGAESGT